MKTAPNHFKLNCGGEEHEIKLISSKWLSLVNHDTEEEEAIRLLGDEPSYCYKWIEAFRIDADDTLCVAARDGHTGMVHLALRLGANPDCHRGLPIRLAAREGHYDIIEQLLSKGAHPNVCSDRPLVLATINGHLAVVTLLIDQGANVNAVRDGAIQLAKQRFHHDVTRYLLSCGINKEELSRRIYNEALESSSDESLVLMLGVSIEIQDLLS